MSNIVLSHLTGNANVRAAAKGFNKANILSGFYVSLATFPGTILNKIGGIGMFSEIRRRSFDADLQRVVHTWPWLEIGRLVALRANWNKLVRQKQGIFHLDAVSSNLDKRVASQLGYESKRGAGIVYGYEDTVLHSFKEAKRLGLKCFYDLPIGYWRVAHRLLEKEKERWPQWVSTINSFDDPDEKNRRKDEELMLADQIFVASTFTANTLKDFPGTLAPVHVIPYGFPKVISTTRDYSNAERSQRLKLLFVGSLSQRKGIADLFAAVEGLESYVDLTLVGNKITNDCDELNKALAKHRWFPSLSHDKVLNLMRENDVLVFPSLFEGFGLVITEAMSQGTPVITTDRTAGPDLIVNNENGWLIEAASTQSLRQKIEELLSQQQKIKSVGLAAMEKARQRPWEVYGHELALMVGSLK